MIFLILGGSLLIGGSVLTLGLAIRYRSKRWISLFLFFTFLLFAGASSGFATFVFRYRIGVYHFVHQRLELRDLYDPIVDEPFPFWEAGYSKTYSLDAKYSDIYSIEMLFSGEGVSKREKLNERIKVEFFWQDHMVLENEIAGIFLWPNGKKHFDLQRSRLMDFDIPLDGKYKKELSVRMTVLEADQILKKYEDSLRLVIKVSSRP